MSCVQQPEYGMFNLTVLEDSWYNIWNSNKERLTNLLEIHTDFIVECDKLNYAYAFTVYQRVFCSKEKTKIMCIINKNYNWQYDNTQSKDPHHQQKNNNNKKKNSHIKQIHVLKVNTENNTWKELLFPDLIPWILHKYLYLRADYKCSIFKKKQRHLKE